MRGSLSRRRQLVMITLVFVVGAIGGGRAGAATAPPPELALPAPAACGQGSWVAGTVDVCSGELVYRDYVYDDFGAATLPGQSPSQILDGIGFSSLPAFDAYGGLPPNGNQRDHDQTDLVALRIRIDSGQVHVSAELNTVLVADAAQVVIAVDRDDSSATGGATNAVMSPAASAAA